MASRKITEAIPEGVFKKMRAPKMTEAITEARIPLALAMVMPKKQKPKKTKAETEEDLMQYQKSVEEIGRSRSYHQNKIEKCIQNLFEEKLCEEHKGTVSYWNYAKYAVCVAIKKKLEDIINDEKFDTYREIQEMIEEIEEDS